MLHQPDATISKETLLGDFWSYVRSAVDRFGQKDFIITKNGALSFFQNNNNANVIAERLTPRFNEPRFGVGLFMKDPLRMIPAMIGVLKTGLYFVPLDVTFPPHTLKQMLEIANISCVLTDDRYAEQAESMFTMDRIDLINCDSLDYTREVADPVVGYKPEDSVQIMFTSGSMGTPKGAIEDYRYLVRSIMVKLWNGDYQPDERLLQASTFTYSAPHTHMFNALVTGASMYYHDLKEDGLAVLADVLREKEITVYHTTPTVFRSFLGTLRPDDVFPGVNKFRAGGEKRLPSDIQAIKRVFPNVKELSLGYASTETQVAASFVYRLDSLPKEGMMPSGKPLRDVEIHIRDENGNDLPAGEEGEIVVGGDSLARGYINNPELTQKHFIQDPTRPGFQYFRSRDFGKLLPSGDLVHLGRIDNMVKIKGVRIELTTLEAHIRQYPGITQVVSRAIEDPFGGKKLVSYFVAEPGAEIPISDLRKYLAERLPAHQLPQFLIQLEKLPLTPNGKISITELPQPSLVRPDLPYPFTPPADELEEKLLAVWEDQLGITGIGVNDDFFDVGGDSLLGVVLVVAIEEAIGAGFPVSVLLQASTVRSQANMIRNQETHKAFSTLLPIHPSGTLPPLFFIPGKGGYPTRIRHLAKALDPEIPVYAMQDLVGYNNPSPRADQLKSIASLCISEIKRVAPQGPYILVGESLGGKICYEIAQQLYVRGEAQSLIIMLDTYNLDTKSSESIEETQGFAHYKTLAAKHLSIWVKSDSKGKLEYLRFYRGVIGKQVKRYLQRKSSNGGETPKIRYALPENVRQLESNLKRADRNYEVASYPGKVILIKALRGPYGNEPANGWDRVDIGRLIIHQLDCYHGSILFEPAVSQLAELVQKHVREMYKDKATIIFDDLSKRYSRGTKREVAALDRISFSITENEFVSIVGPSGCGKTTFLKIVARLIKPDTGQMIFEGYENPSAILVFQDQGVLPWLTVLDNVGLGLELKGIPKTERQRQAREFMKVIRLDGFENYYPHELSGGMRQRVALARAFLTNPDLLLMDEPFGALDAQTRIVLQEELLDIWREYPKTVLFVTHDIDEAILLSDRVIVMSDRPGKIQAAIDIPFSRPRDLSQKDDPRFLEIRWKIWNLLEKEVREDIKIVQEKHPG